METAPFCRSEFRSNLWLRVYFPSYIKVESSLLKEKHPLVEYHGWILKKYSILDSCGKQDLLFWRKINILRNVCNFMFSFSIEKSVLGFECTVKKGWTMEMHLFLSAEVRKPVYAFFASLLCELLKIQKFFEEDQRSLKEPMSIPRNIFQEVAAPAKLCSPHRM